MEKPCPLEMKKMHAKAQHDTEQIRKLVVRKIRSRTFLNSLKFKMDQNSSEETVYVKHF